MNMQVNTAPRSAKRVKRKSFFHRLPDDLVIPLLSRLPAEDVIRCRQVCRRWRDLTSTQYFNDLHMPSQGTVILGNSDKNGRDILPEFLLDKWWESEKRLVSVIHKFNNYPVTGYPQCSGNGFLVLKSEYNLRNFVVFNPISHHNNNVTITFPKTLFRRTEALAIYFHPILKQYCILWAVYWRKRFQPKYDHPDEKGVQYQILILGPKPCWRNISNPWIRNVKNPYKPTILVDNYLYWLVKPVEKNYGKFAIIEFDIISEELKVMPSPVLCQATKLLKNNKNISLLNVCGILSVFLISDYPSEKLVYQWTLTDRVLLEWTCSTYRIINMCQFDKPARAIALTDTGDLLIESDKICVLNIKLGTMRKLVRCGYSYSGTTFMSHVITFASLSSCNCKSNITLLHVRNKSTGQLEKCTRQVLVL